MKTRTLSYILALAGAISLLAACEDHRNDYLDEFSTMIYFRNGGEQSLTLYRTGEDGIYRIPVCKSGRNLEGTANAVVIPFDEAQMSMYNIKNETSYKLIPKDLWSFVDAQRNALSDQSKVNLEFSPSDAFKVVNVGIKTVDLSHLMEQDEDAVYVLGLQVFADESVSQDINIILLKPDIEVPFVSLVSPGIESHKYTSASPMKETYHNTVTLNMDENLWDFTCSIEAADAEWLQNYNRANGKSFVLLPASAFKLSTNELSFKSGVLDALFDVEISRDGMDMLTEYALPIVITGCSKSEFSIDESKNVYILNVRLDPDQITLTEDMVSVSHNQSNDGDGAPALVDGKEATYWHSPWSSAVTDPDPVYGVYADIALKSPLKAIVVNYCTRAQNGNGIPVHMVIGVSNDKTNWTVIENGDVANEEMASATTGQWITLPVMKHSTSFSYVRIGVAESVAGDLRVPGTTAWTAIAELQLFGTDN